LIVREGLTVKSYTAEELAQANGEDGKITLVAVEGKVYDVSASKRWGRGEHMKRHRAGMNLTNDIKAAPHGLEVLERFEVVGLYEQARAEPAAGLKGRIELWLDRHPFFRRHPHPAVVHIPVGLMTVVPLFELGGLATNSSCTEWAALSCLILGWLAIPAAMMTGYFTWWINYDASDSGIILMKRRLAWVAVALGALAIALRLFVLVDPLETRDIYVIVYVVSLIALTVVVSSIGFLGGKLTFPYEANKG
jgi:predicted heme/steroid binding protein/uncharacterized membrane protein